MNDSSHRGPAYPDTVYQCAGTDEYFVVEDFVMQMYLFVSTGTVHGCAAVHIYFTYLACSVEEGSPLSSELGTV